MSGSKKLCILAKKTCRKTESLEMCSCRNLFHLHEGCVGHIYCQVYNHIGFSTRASAEKQRKSLTQHFCKMLPQTPSHTSRVPVQDNTTQTSHGPSCRPINSVAPDRRTARQNAKASHLVQGIKRGGRQVTFQPWAIKPGDAGKKGGGEGGGGGQRSRRLPENNGVGGK